MQEPCSALLLVGSRGGAKGGAGGGGVCVETRCVRLQQQTERNSAGWWGACSLHSGLLGARLPWQSSDKTPYSTVGAKTCTCHKVRAKKRASCVC